MDQAAFSDGLCFDLLSPFEYDTGSTEVDIGGGLIAEALVISAMDLLLDGVADGLLQRAKVPPTIGTSSMPSKGGRKRLACQAVRSHDQSA